MSTQSPPGPDGVINARLVESLVNKLKIEEDDIRVKQYLLIKSNVNLKELM